MNTGLGKGAEDGQLDDWGMVQHEILQDLSTKRAEDESSSSNSSSEEEGSSGSYLGRGLAALLCILFSCVCVSAHFH